MATPSSERPPDRTGGGLGKRLHHFAYQTSATNRARKWKLFNATYPPNPEWPVIDVGFSPGGKVESDNYFEKHYPHTSKITALTIAPIGDSPERYPDITVVRYEGKVIPFDDKTFELVWSNAVVEHVGGRDAQVQFIREVDRVATRHFITTPNRWFLFEVHTKLPLVHWLPKPIFDRIAKKLGKGWATGSYMNLLSRRQFERALREAGVTDYHITANRFLGVPMDFVATW